MDKFLVPNNWKIFGWPVDIDAAEIMPWGEHGPRPRGPGGEFVPHDGIDLTLPAGTPVYASGHGRVELVETDAESGDGSGNAVWLSHINGIFQTAYLHLLEAPLVSVGETVDESTLLGYVGDSGNAPTEHLCFETKIRGHAVNPRQLIREYGRPADVR